MIYKLLLLGEEMRRLLVLSVAISLLAFLLLDCKHRAAPTLIRIAQGRDILTLDPVVTDDSTTLLVLSNMYEYLLDIGKDTRIQPQLAVSWSAPDERTWIFQIRQNVFFHNGQKLTADDVKYSLERARDDRASIFANYLSNVESVTKDDSFTIRLKTKTPDALLLNRLSSVPIISKSHEDLNIHPAGTGPYRFVRHGKGVVELAAYGNYWGGRPNVDHVEFVVKDSEQIVPALGKKEVDLYRFVGGPLVAKLEAIPGVRIQSMQGLSNCYLWFDSRPKQDTENPFSKQEVRQAVAIAINRKELVKRIGGFGTPADQIVPPGVFGNVPNWKGIVYDPARAKALLEQAGYPKGFETTLTVSREGVLPQTTAHTVADMLGAVGIKVNIEQQDWPDMVEKWERADMPFFVAIMRFDNADASGFLSECVRTRESSAKSSNPGFSDPELDQMIQRIPQIFRTTDREKHYEKMMMLMHERMPLVPLYNRHRLYALQSRVVWEPRLDERILVSEMSVKQ